VVLARRPIGNGLAAGKAQVDSNVIEVALLMMLVGSLDGYAAARDVLGELLELRGALAHRGLDGRRAVDVVKHDLQRDLHKLLLARPSVLRV
jgi:hypothetical protein